MKHRPIRSFLNHPQTRMRSALVAVLTMVPLLFASGCSPIPETAPAEKAAEHVGTEPASSASTHDGNLVPDSSVEELPGYTAQEKELVYYGEVLSYRYGIDVSPDEWLHLAEQECGTFNDDQSTNVYGPASADALENNQRSELLLESFVFLVVGTDMCGSSYAGSGFERFGSDALLISIAFMATVVDTVSLDFSAPDFAEYYDNQLFITRYDTSLPSEPETSEPHEDYEEDEIDPPEYPDVPRDGPLVEYEGNAEGPTVCSDGTVSNSAGSGTCSHHGGER